VNKGIEWLGISVGSLEVDQRIGNGLQLYVKEYRRSLLPFFVGTDIFYSQIENKGTTSFGISTVPSGYFGIDFKAPSDRLDFILSMIAARNYSSRSKLTQAGLSVQFDSIGYDNESGKVKIGTRITSLTGKPIINIPDTFKLFRLFINDFQFRVEGEELKNIAPSIFPPEYQLIQVSNRFVTAQLPIINYYSIGADIIDIGAILATQNRQQLDQVLQLQPIEESLPDQRFVLGETGIINFPPTHLGAILVGADENHNIHLPSLIIDPGFEGPLRVEIDNIGSRQPQVVEFHLIKLS